MSRDDYYQSANLISDSERGAEEPIKEGKDQGTPLAGDHGGRGELAEGYSSRQPPTTAPDAELVGAGDDPYGGYDPGMAGCTMEQNTCHIPGLPWMGIAPLSPAQTRPHPHARTESRGYERDEDEYAGSFASSTTPELKSSVPQPLDPARVPLPDTDASTETSPVPALGASAPVQPDTDTAAESGGPHPPSIGTRLVGRVERLAGKVFRDPSMEARGKRHMTGHL
ncbi:hypothetical protein EV363DRAFT_1443235 [Boletus edulis]|nr:hypothetical protein EV363DRAFT_1443235 [Boletus edulis]